MRSRTIAALAMFALAGMLAVAGCSTTEVHPSPQSPLPTDLIATARHSEGAPAELTTTSPATACGNITLGQGEQVPSAAVDCFEAAIGTTDAELVVVSPTTEGDPIVTFYRTMTDVAGFDSFTNSQFDRYGPDGWSHLRCPATATLGAMQDCVEVSAGG